VKRKHIIIVVIAGVLILANFARFLAPKENYRKKRSDTSEYKIRKKKKKRKDTVIKDSIIIKKNEDLPYNPTDSKQNIRLMSWNIQNFGKSKSPDELKYIAKTMKDMDIVAIQEVSSTFVGPQTVAKLADELNRTGNKWAYTVSDPTVGAGVERYAYLWKPNRVKLVGEAFLEKSLANEIDREPFLARFECKGEKILLVNFHAIPKTKNPAQEIQLLPRIQNKYTNEKIVMMGDFNLSQKDPAFDGLKQKGLKPALINVKTSFRMHDNPAAPGQYFSEEYDNFYFNSNHIEAKVTQRIDIAKDFRSVEDARKISDHVPIILEFIPRTQRREDFQR